MRLLSWNVNGIRAVSKKGFEDSVLSTGSDIVCLQEVRANPSDFKFSSLPTLSSKYTSQLWNPAVKKGYSGTMMLIDTKVPSYGYKAGLEAINCEEGRVQTLDLGFSFLVNVYTPNAGRELVRLPYRTSWDTTFLSYLRELQKTKPIIVCGDLNVAHREIDLARPKPNVGKAGFTNEERAGITTILQDADLIDSFRWIHGDVPGHYSWWSNMGGARAKNIGWRIDYFLVDRKLAPKLKEAKIYPEIFGSDHCPVGITLSL